MGMLNHPCDLELWEKLTGPEYVYTGKKRLEIYRINPNHPVPGDWVVRCSEEGAPNYTTFTLSYKTQFWALHRAKELMRQYGPSQRKEHILELVTKHNTEIRELMEEHNSL